MHSHDPSKPNDITRNGVTTDAITPDTFQIEAFEAIDRGESVLVAAPTGSGKTLIAEYAIDAALRRGQRAFYTTPIKALSNQKFHDLGRIFGTSQVGILTGDNAIRPDAPVVVMTTEVLRNMIYGRNPSLTNLGVIVIDEVHFLQDRYRGPVWEEVIVHAPDGPRLVCLSATVSNADELGEWISALRGPTSTVITSKRPVELEYWFAADRMRSKRLDVVRLFAHDRGASAGGGEPRPRRANPDGKRFEVQQARHGGSRSSRDRGDRFRTPGRSEMVSYLADHDMLPAIWFVFSRRGCDDAVASVRRNSDSLTSKRERTAIASIIDAHVADISSADLDALGYRAWRAGLESGIASHHAGHIPAFKEATEEAFVSGLLKVVFATETLALGINMPARTVIIDKLTKYSGPAAGGTAAARHDLLTPAQFTQMTGRAGRRGIDTVGHAIVLWSPFTPFTAAAELAGTKHFPLRSAFKPTYNMTVNLIERHAERDAISVLRRSFAQFQMDRRIVADAQQLRQWQRRADQYLATATCERGDVVAALDDSVRAADRQRTSRADRLDDGTDSDHNSSHSSSDHRARAVDISAALSRLKPGTVLELGPGEIAVTISVGVRTSDRVNLRMMSTTGRVFTRSTPDFAVAPRVVALLDLPRPFRPTESAWRRKVAAAFDLFVRLSGDSLRDDGAATWGNDGNSNAGGQVGSSSRSGHTEDHARLHEQRGHAAVRSCPDFAAHVAAWNRYKRLQRDITRLEGRTASANTALESEFDAIRKVLERRGYTEGWQLTDRGRRLARIYHECDLLISVALESGLLDGLAQAELAATVSMFTYESRRADQLVQPVFPTDTVRRRYESLSVVQRQIASEEREHALPPTREIDAGFADAVFQWCNGVSLGVIVDADSDSAGGGGDFVRNIKQVIDLMRQISDVADRGELSRLAETTANRLRRGVVEQSLTGRMPSDPADHTAMAARPGGE